MGPGLPLMLQVLARLGVFLLIGKVLVYPGLSAQHGSPQTQSHPFWLSLHVALWSRKRSYLPLVVSVTSLDCSASALLSLSSICLLSFPPPSGFCTLILLLGSAGR